MAAWAFAAAAIGGTVRPAPAAVACSSDTFAIDGSSVAVRICRDPQSDAIVETASVRGKPALERRVPYARVEHQETARTIDDLPLAELGIARTLHVTVAIRTNAVRLEHALLVPGAVALK